MIINSIETAILTAQKRKWDKTYWAIDIHGTILEPNYEFHNLPKKFYPLAKETLQLLSQKKDICLILYTCSHPSEIVDYLQLFKSLNIDFQYINKNPEVQSKDYGYFEDKFYFNVLLDDKAGFNPFTEWNLIHQWLVK